VKRMDWLNGLIMVNAIGIGSNLDNCGVGIAYGSKNMKFPHRINAVVNAIGFCAALTGAWAGKTVSHYLSPVQAAWTACLVLVGIGLFFWYSAYIHPWLSPKKAESGIEPPGWKQGVVLGAALSITNVASGFGATVANAAAFWGTVFSITAWGYLMIWAGNVIGIGILARILGKYASFAAGLILILVGIHQLSGS
jgi:putative Mn2+ efflux pump MntP